MNSRYWFGLAAWIAIPVLFAVTARSTYIVVDAKVFPSFFPGQNYWLALIVLFAATGFLLLAAGVRPVRRWWLVVYPIVMGAALLIAQGTVSCMSGDCI